MFNAQIISPSPALDVASNFKGLLGRFLGPVQSCFDNQMANIVQENPHRNVLSKENNNLGPAIILCRILPIRMV